jgi:hypothetical protein
MSETEYPDRPKPISPSLLNSCEYGTVISNTLIETQYGISEDDPNFSLAQMKFKTRLETILGRDYNMPCTICIKDGMVKILTHAEASEYHKNRFNTSILKMGRSFYKNRQVNSSEFEKANQKEHERNLEIQGKVLQSVVQVHPDIKLEAHKRKTPLPLFDESDNRQ